MPQLEQAMRKLFKYFKDKVSFLNIDQAHEGEYCTSVVHFYYSINSEEVLGFMSNGKMFEWRSFETETLTEEPKKALKEISF